MIVRDAEVFSKRRGRCGRGLIEVKLFNGNVICQPRFLCGKLLDYLAVV